MNKSLPIFYIFFESIKIIYKNKLLLLIYSIPTVIGFILFFSFSFISALSISFIVFLISLSFVLFFYASIIMLTVSTHRIFLLPKNKIMNMRSFRWQKCETKFFGWILLLYLLIGIPFYVLDKYYTIPYLTSINTISDMNKFIIFLISTPFYYVMVRLSLVLPNTVIDAPKKGLSWSWHMTKGNGWYLYFLIYFLPHFFNYFVIPFIIFSLNIILKHIGIYIIEEPIYIAINIFLFFMAIGMLSLSYRHLYMDGNTYKDSE